MAIQFKKYVERRDHCKAFQYLDSSQAHDIATVLFASHEYSLSENGDRLLVRLQYDYQLKYLKGPITANNELIINRGDYIIEGCGTYEVVSRHDFRPKWEEENV